VTLDRWLYAEEMVEYLSVSREDR